MRPAAPLATLPGQHGHGAAMRATKTIALTLSTLAAMGGAAALADVKASDDRRGDATCEGPPCPDLKSAVANPGIFDASQLFYIVTQHNAVRGSLLPRIAINARGPDTSAPEFYVERRGSRTGVFKVKSKRKVGPAALRTYPTSLSWTFSRRSIGDPASYGWRAEIVAKGGARVDATPDRGYLEHVPG
jgi:hypothetical protein